MLLQLSKCALCLIACCYGDITVVLNEKSYSDTVILSSFFYYDFSSTLIYIKRATCHYNNYIYNRVCILHGAEDLGISWESSLVYIYCEFKSVLF